MRNDFYLTEFQEQLFEDKAMKNIFVEPEAVYDSQADNDVLAPVLFDNRSYIKAILNDPEENTSDIKDLINEIATDEAEIEEFNQWWQARYAAYKNIIAEEKTLLDSVK